jgi:hypothetical protein
MSETRRGRHRWWVLVTVLVLLAPGCHVAPRLPDPPPSHPASPVAPEASPPPSTSTLDLVVPGEKPGATGQKGTSPKLEQSLQQDGEPKEGPGGS